MAKTRTFDINYFNTIVGGIAPEAYADGECVTFAPDGDDYTFVSGADGATGRNRTNIKSGILEISLLQHSSTNIAFSKLRTADLTTPGGVMFAVNVKDSIGQTAIKSDECCFTKPPDMAFGNGDASTFVWSIKMTNIDLDNSVFGGNVI
jgi:hypothetical protein